MSCPKLSTTWLPLLLTWTPTQWVHVCSVSVPLVFGLSLTLWMIEPIHQNCFPLTEHTAGIHSKRNLQRRSVLHDQLCFQNCSGLFHEKVALIFVPNFSCLFFSCRGWEIPRVHHGLLSSIHYGPSRKYRVGLVSQSIFIPKKSCKRNTCIKIWFTVKSIWVWRGKESVQN